MLSDCKESSFDLNFIDCSGNLLERFLFFLSVIGNSLGFRFKEI